VATQQTPQVATQQTPQVATQQTPQVATQQTPQVATQQTPSAATQQMSSLIKTFVPFVFVRSLVSTSTYFVQCRPPYKNNCPVVFILNIFYKHYTLRKEK
jgi:hypothetical protein